MFFVPEFARVQKHSKIQIPELVSNLLENQRSLTDKISKKGQTEAFQQRDIKWNAAHRKYLSVFIEIISLPF
jgi:hypothetical protein